MIHHEIACAFTGHFLWVELPSLLLTEYEYEFCGHDWLSLPNPKMIGFTDYEFNMKIPNVTTPYGGNQAKCLTVSVCVFIHVYIHVYDGTNMAVGSFFLSFFNLYLAE